jgi:hypothetical protein
VLQRELHEQKPKSASGKLKNWRRKAAELVAEAERERKAQVARAETGNEIELQILRVAPNPRLVICAYRGGSEERRCIVRVGRNTNFRRGMKLLVKRPGNGTETETWAYDGLLPRRTGRW